MLLRTYKASLFLLSTFAAGTLTKRQTATLSDRTVTWTPATESFEIFPTGFRDSKGSWEAPIPLACNIGCYPVVAPYLSCFVLTNQLLEPFRLSQELCDDIHCSPGNFTQLVQCLNCIVANGGERPYEAVTNTNFDFSTAIPPGVKEAGIPGNPEGYIDDSQARGWIRNVTERCESIGRPLTAVEGVTEITATATATGPYTTAWTSGEIVTITPYAGLASYSEITQNVPSASSGSPAPTSGQSADSQPTGSQSASGQTTAPASPPNAAAASATPSNAGRRSIGEAGLAVVVMAGLAGGILV